jgi:hypothetical protein
MQVRKGAGFRVGSMRACYHVVQGGTGVDRHLRLSSGWTGDAHCRF